MSNTTNISWPNIGEQAERTAILYALLEELEIYELMLEKLLTHKEGKSGSALDLLAQERSTRSEIKARESMIRVLALKNTPFVV